MVPNLNVRINWLNAFLAVCLGIIAATLMNYRDWHTGTFTGWSLFGFAIIAVGAAFVGALLVLSSQSHVRWPVWVASVLSLGLGIASVPFVQNVGISWKDAIIGLGALVVLGGLLMGISLTTWQKPTT